MSFENGQSFELQRKGDFRFFYTYPGSVVGRNPAKPKISVLDESGQEIVIRSFMNGHSSGGGQVSVAIGKKSLNAGVYTLKVSEEQYSRFADDSASIKISTNSILSLIAAIFCFVFPAVAFLILGLSALF
ncbi:MAG: hypothetical protein HRT45_11430 [Bdellovibrionales bacterium]|nr:hypothetical protein [Bdellovibrionales bacterium]